MRNRERIATLLFPTGYLSEIGPYPAFDPRLRKTSWGVIGARTQSVQHFLRLAPVSPRVCPPCVR